MAKKKKQRGGIRPGAGRPKKEATKVIAWRVPKKIATGLKKKIDPIVDEEVKNHQTKQNET